jgi:hypothetical protein
MIKPMKINEMVGHAAVMNREISKEFCFNMLSEGIT